MLRWSWRRGQMLGTSRVTRLSIMTCLNLVLSRRRLRNLMHQPQSNQESLTRTHRRCGRLGTSDRTLLLPAPTPEFAGRITRLSLSIVGGTAQPGITITIGTTVFTTASATL